MQWLRCAVSEDNTLLAHAWEQERRSQMIAAGNGDKSGWDYAQKNLYVVPNHLTEQWGVIFYVYIREQIFWWQRRKDFEPANRKNFVPVLQQGIMMRSSSAIRSLRKSLFRGTNGRLPSEDQIERLRWPLKSGTAGRAELYHQAAGKNKEDVAGKAGRNLMTRTRKDDVVTFEQLGVDRLFVDESHSF